MATLSQDRFVQGTGDERFFLRGAIVMAVIIAAGFSFQLAMGRSTFASPVRVHIHALLFMGWVTIFLLQNILVSVGRVDLHRKLGWLAAGWMVAMVISGFLVTLAMVRNGVVPFFFRPLHFLIFDPVQVLTFAGLTIAAVALRRRTDWHRRLHYSGMALLLGPAFGRLMPMPLLPPYAWEVTFVATLVVLGVTIALDTRRRGALHPAWRWAVGVWLGMFVVIEALTYSPLGVAIYDRAVAGTAGASVDPLAFPPPPEGPLITGRTD
ncbi:MAG TPA: hypothetical protein VFK50_03365 [Sphingomicrobium sp.]|nr:hypothetical protein [Sphingomicrobium sp.]